MPSKSTGENYSRRIDVSRDDTHTTAVILFSVFYLRIASLANRLEATVETRSLQTRSWNFQKYLLDRAAKTIGMFERAAEPDDPLLDG